MSITRFDWFGEVDPEGWLVDYDDHLAEVDRLIKQLDKAKADHLADVQRFLVDRTVDRHGMRQVLVTLREYEITPEYPLPTLIDGAIWVLEEHLKEETHD